MPINTKHKLKYMPDNFEGCITTNRDNVSILRSKMGVQVK